MKTMEELLIQFGLPLVFLNIGVEQLGVPVPAYPILIVTGALSVDGWYSAWALLGTAVAACLIADVVWYVAGRRFGGRVLRTVCRISLSPDSCVRQTESLFARWGVWSLLVAKLVPGFGTIATVLSGNLRVPILTFLFFDALGAALYAGIGIGLGVLFHQAVDGLLVGLQDLGRVGLLMLAVALVLFIAAKLWQRQRLIHEFRGARISVLELSNLVASGRAHAIIDVRTDSVRAREGAIPGALAWPNFSEDIEIARVLPQVSQEAEVVVYCACPNEASAALVARRLRAAGFRNVRPLHGGIHAWIEAGFPVEPGPAT
jgi:membrane protein DedA with SNARE-associated domain/rhodanese-related sulfurtransferase